MGCIYKIINNINNKIYIGYTTVDIKIRMRQHKNDDIKYNTILGRAIKKYGWDNFSYEIVEESNNKEKLLELEKYYISFYDCCILDGMEKGYNMTRGGEKLYGNSNPFYGHKHTEEVKSKISILAKQRTGEKNPFYGKQHSTETKKKISQANSKPIMAFNNDKSIVLKFNNGIEAKEYLLKNNLTKSETCNSSIVKAIKKNQRAFGFYWTYI